MHGMIFGQLKKYVNTKLGDGAWEKLLGAAGMTGRMYVPVREYPDADVVQLVTTASRLTGASAPAILEDFGAFLVPDLVAMYKPLIRPEWRTLDVIENTEATIHKAVRATNPGAAPPELKVTRLSPTELRLSYTSAPKLCPVAKGIARGIAKEYGETLRVTESSCMHQGAESCEITFAMAG
jgi:hypothetical protein